MFYGLRQGTKLSEASNKLSLELPISINAVNLITEMQTFRSKKLDKDEEGCVSKCTEKFLKLNKRAGFRFAEINFANSGKKMED
mmetsp:Transcript_65389/g.128378  ORF Transcript_65389/g.128378 Transcript_65389/m.128378 type:complete len:84 (-) Transcript_65389:271-522(-)